MSLHIALHESAWMRWIGGGGLGRIARFLVAAICAVGLYRFVDGRFWEKLFHWIDYQKEYDYSRSAAAITPDLSLLRRCLWRQHGC